MSREPAFSVCQNVTSLCPMHQATKAQERKLLQVHGRTPVVGKNPQTVSPPTVTLKASFGASATRPGRCRPSVSSPFPVLAGTSHRACVRACVRVRSSSSVPPPRPALNPAELSSGLGHCPSGS